MLKVVHDVFDDNNSLYSMLSSSLCRHDGTHTRQQQQQQHQQQSQQQQQHQQQSQQQQQQQSNASDVLLHDDTSQSPIRITYRGHYAPLFGTICGLLGINLEYTQIMYMRCVLRDALSAACRLNLLGPIEAAKWQLKMSYRIENMLLKSDMANTSSSSNKDVNNQSNHQANHQTQAQANCTKHCETEPLVSNDMKQYLSASNVAYLEGRSEGKRRKMDTMKSVAPILDLLQSQHEQLYSRLFTS